MSPEQKRTTSILAVAIDNRELLQKMVDRITKTDGRRPDYAFLSDPGHRVIDRYGLWNPEGQGWPHPTVYVLDRKGVVRWKFVEVDYRQRPGNEEILAALAGLQ